MLSRWPILLKLLFGVVMLCLIVAILSFSSFNGVYAYREVVRTVSRRAMELQPAAELTAQVGELRFALRQAQPLVDFPGGNKPNAVLLRNQFDVIQDDVGRKLEVYEHLLDSADPGEPFIGDTGREKAIVEKIKTSLARIRQLSDETDWVLDRGFNAELSSELEHLNALAGDLPKCLQQRMQGVRDQVTAKYRTFIVLTWVTTVLTAVIVLLLVRVFYVWIIRPLGVLIAASRRVAAGDFGHRIQLQTDDEMAELASAMNAMTDRFQQVRDDLDQEVKQRTREVVRGEQLASVGFLAAGVAHEINNPLASIAWSAESLESRLYEILHDIQGRSHAGRDVDRVDPELDNLRQYLRRIQDEAFRCKGITEQLLDFSRMGDSDRQKTDLGDLTRGVIEMVKHLGKYRHKRIEFQSDHYVVISANAQEIKQVVLNLVTNALDSLEADGLVTVSLERSDATALLTVKDNGIGMTDDILEHLFEPFFTRRRDGHGTGLGLSISYRIVTDHGGQIHATSAGPGQGSEFRVTFPLSNYEQEKQDHGHAA